MKKIIFVLFIFFSVSIVYQSTIGKGLKPKIEYYKTISKLNIRTNEGKNAPLHFVLEKDSEVEVLSKSNDNKWFKIEYQGKEGYAFSKYLKIDRIVDNEKYQQQKELKQKVELYFKIFIYIAIVAGLAFICFKIYKKFKTLLIRLRNKKSQKYINNLKKGEAAERSLMLELLKFGMHKDEIFHDLYVKKDSREFSQIDAVALTKVGLIVFEVKNYSGNIYGDNNYPNWIQSLSYGKEKKYFQNPIRQNKGHIESLKRKFGGSSEIPFFSCIVFFGSCELQNIRFTPEGTFVIKSERIIEALKDILRTYPKIKYSNRKAILQVLQEACRNGANKKNKKQHVENINNKLGTKRVYY